MASFQVHIAGRLIGKPLMLRPQGWRPIPQPAVHERLFGVRRGKVPAVLSVPERVLRTDWGSDLGQILGVLPKIPIDILELE